MAKCKGTPPSSGDRIPAKPFGPARFAKGDVRTAIQNAWRPESGDGIEVPSLLAAVVVVVVLASLTQALLSVAHIVPNSRPYPILYIVPVALAAASFGVFGGLVTGIAGLLLAKYLLFAPGTSPWSFATEDDVIRYMTTALGLVVVATVTGSLRSSVREQRTLHKSLLESENRRMAFNREVLQAVTGGRLVLCDRSEILEGIPDPSDSSVELREPSDAATLRSAVRQLDSTGPNLGPRLEDLFTSVTEAAGNAIKHGGGGTARLWASEDEIRVLIIDSGPGISPTELARATLERGYSSRSTLGMGFILMLETADRLALSTGPGGTAVLLRVGSAPRRSMEDDILAGYAGI